MASPTLARMLFVIMLRMYWCVAAYFVVVVYMTRFSLEKKHRRVTVEYAGTKEQELQEQLSLQAMQIKKKDARIAYFEKNRNRK